MVSKWVITCLYYPPGTSKYQNWHLTEIHFKYRPNFLTHHGHMETFVWVVLGPSKCRVSVETSAKVCGKMAIVPSHWDFMCLFYFTNRTQGAVTYVHWGRLGKEFAHITKNLRNSRKNNLFLGQPREFNGMTFHDKVGPRVKKHPLLVV